MLLFLLDILLISWKGSVYAHTVSGPHPRSPHSCRPSMRQVGYSQWAVTYSPVAAKYLNKLVKRWLILQEKHDSSNEKS